MSNKDLNEKDLRTDTLSGEGKLQEKTEETQNRIKREDKKAMRIFIPLMIVSFFFGAFGGFFVLILKNFLTGDSGVSFVETFHNLQLSITDPVCYLVLFASLAFSIAGGILFAQAKKQIEAMDSTDEEFANRADEKMNYVLLIVSVHTIVSWLLTGIGLYGLSVKEDFNLIPLLVGVGGFIISLIDTTILQQRVVNYVKNLNPEKRGSVFDPKFQKEWINSCDEAERFYIYRCSFTSYRITQFSCMVLLVILLIIGMAFPIGIVPFVCVCIIWGVQTLSYAVTAIRLSYSSGSVM